MTDKRPLGLTELVLRDAHHSPRLPLAEGEWSDAQCSSCRDRSSIDLNDDLPPLSPLAEIFLTQANSTVPEIAMRVVGPAMNDITLRAEPTRT